MTIWFLYYFGWPSKNQYLPNSVTHQPVAGPERKQSPDVGRPVFWVNSAGHSFGNARDQSTKDVSTAHIESDLWIFPIIVARSLSCSGLCGLGNEEPLKLSPYYYLIDDSFDFGSRSSRSEESRIIQDGNAAFCLACAGNLFGQSNHEQYRSLGFTSLQGFRHKSERFQPGNPTFFIWCFVGFGGCYWCAMVDKPRPKSGIYRTLFVKFLLRTYQFINLQISYRFIQYFFKPMWRFNLKKVET